VSIPLLCLLAAVAAEPEERAHFPVVRATPLFAEALRSEGDLPARSRNFVRGQTPTYDDNPYYGSPGGVPGGETYAQPGLGVEGFQGAPYGDPYGAPAGPGMPGAAPFQMSPYGSDPFLGQPGGDVCGDGCYGVFGPQPFHYGWQSFYDVGWLPKESTGGVPGKFEVLEFNMAWRYTTPTPSGMIFAWTPQGNIRLWSGPTGEPPPAAMMPPIGVALPGQVYRIASDFELTIPAGPWSAQLGFTPAVVSDFEDNLSSDGYSFDGRGVLFYRASPAWMFAFGAAYWDRVKDRVIPYAGVVWTPNDRWEFRLLFPKSRISWFLGSYNGVAWWFYGSGEFNVEAYEVKIENTGVKDRIEVSDWRLLLGIRTESAGISTFIEGGWVIDRHAHFKGPTTDFGIDDGWLLRAGLRF